MNFFSEQNCHSAKIRFYVLSVPRLSALFSASSWVGCCLGQWRFIQPPGDPLYIPRIVMGIWAMWNQRSRLWGCWYQAVGCVNHRILDQRPGSVNGNVLQVYEIPFGDNIAARLCYLPNGLCLSICLCYWLRSLLFWGRIMLISMVTFDLKVQISWMPGLLTRTNK